MHIYLIRHADASPLGEWGVTRDEERPLSKAGEEQSRMLGAELHKKGITLNAVVTSPLLRARRTSEEMLEAGPRPAPPLRICEDIAPGGKRKRLARFLRDLGADKVGVVGHQPDLGKFVAWLIGSKNAHIDLAKAGVAYVVCDREPTKGGGKLIWLVTPEILKM
jgi:phosphohistidine phosphatase